MCNTINHAAKPEFEYEEDYPGWWDWFVKKQIKSMRDYFDVAIRHCTVEGKNPMYICRYEDLLVQPKEELMKLFAFLLDEEDLTGTNCERRIDEVVAMGSGASVTYKLKNTTGKFNVQAKRYNEEQIEYIKETLDSQLYFFGYANHPEEENATAFFDFADHKPENLEQHYGFRKLNDDSMKEVIQPNRPVKKYHICTDVLGDVLDEEDLDKIQNPCKDYARKTMLNKQN